MPSLFFPYSDVTLIRRTRTPVHDEKCVFQSPGLSTVTSSKTTSVALASSTQCGRP